MPPLLLFDGGLEVRMQAVLCVRIHCSLLYEKVRGGVAAYIHVLLLLLLICTGLSGVRLGTGLARCLLHFSPCSCVYVRPPHMLLHWCHDHMFGVSGAN